MNFFIKVVLKYKYNRPPPIISKKFNLFPYAAKHLVESRQNFTFAETVGQLLCLQRRPHNCAHFPPDINALSFGRDTVSRTESLFKTVSFGRGIVSRTKSLSPSHSIRLPDCRTYLPDDKGNSWSTSYWLNPRIRRI